MRRAAGLLFLGLLGAFSARAQTPVATPYLDNMFEKEQLTPEQAKTVAGASGCGRHRRRSRPPPPAVPSSHTAFHTLQQVYGT